MKEWFRARNSWGAAIRTLSDEEAGRLMKALWEYTMTGNQIELQGIEKGIFALILFSLEQDEKHDEELAKKRAISGAAGGKQKAANARFATDSVANVANAINKNKNQKQIENQNNNQSQKTDPLFERFWDAYPKHVGKEEARNAFEMLHPDQEQVEKMIAAIEKWKGTRQWNEEGDRYIPNPANWLIGKRWKDELPKPAKPKPTVIAQMYEQRDYSGVDAELMAMQDREMEERILEKMNGEDI